mgnify:CR=1 FL=1
MTWTCPTCDAMWSRHSLSVRNPECPACQREICARCDSTNCFTCGRVLHALCAVTVGEDDYCEKCGAAALKQAMLDELADLPVGELQRVALLAKNDFLKGATLEELLAASKAIAETRRAA